MQPCCTHFSTTKLHIHVLVYKDLRGMCGEHDKQTRAVVPVVR